jgi:hypothetical protein
MTPDPHDKMPTSSEEWVPEDDTIIARAVWRSLGVLALVGVIVAVIVLQSGTPDEAPENAATVVVPAMPVRAEVKAPPARFTHITTTAGIDFVHRNGAVGDKLLPETMGGGVAFFDYDGDRDADLLLINSAHWPDHEAAGTATMGLYRNDGSGRFEDVTVAAGLNISLFGMGVAVGDYDNDGDRDLYITAVGPNRLLRNDGGRFSDQTAAAGVTGGDNAWGTGAAFFDYDLDGDLDLWVCDYVEWSRDIDFAVDYRLVGVGRAYGVPTHFKGTHSALYRNDNGLFIDVSAEAGLHINHPTTGAPIGKGLAVGITDFDGDGHPDVFVANDTVQNFLFRNKGDGTFEELGAMAGLGYDSGGNATGAMGTDIADFRNEGVLGIGIGNFANEMTSLYLADQDPMQFNDVAIVEGIGAPSRNTLTFGLFFFDFDLDGRLDLLQVNGHLEDEINTVQPSQHYRQPAQLFWNAGPDQRSCFIEVPREELGDVAEPIVGRGSAYADIDGDGDLDVIMTQVGGAPRLLRNDLVSDRHYLRVRLIGQQSNRDAIGARCRLVQADGMVQERRVTPSRSYLSQSERVLTFGLGANPAVGRLDIDWPGGSTETIEGLMADREVTIVQGQGLQSP